MSSAINCLPLAWHYGSELVTCATFCFGCGIGGCGGAVAGVWWHGDGPCRPACWWQVMLVYGLWQFPTCVPLIGKVVWEGEGHVVVLFLFKLSMLLISRSRLFVWVHNCHMASGFVDQRVKEYVCSNRKRCNHFPIEKLKYIKKTGGNTTFSC